MKIVTFLRDLDGPVEAATVTEFFALPAEDRDNWEEWVWQDVPDKATAIARHDEAHERWHADQMADRAEQDTY